MDELIEKLRRVNKLTEEKKSAQSPHVYSVTGTYPKWWEGVAATMTTGFFSSAGGAAYNPGGVGGGLYGVSNE